MPIRPAQEQTGSHAEVRTAYGYHVLPSAGLPRLPFQINALVERMLVRWSSRSLASSRPLDAWTSERAPAASCSPIVFHGHACSITRQRPALVNYSQHLAGSFVHDLGGASAKWPPYALSRAVVDALINKSWWRATFGAVLAT